MKKAKKLLSLALTLAMLTSGVSALAEEAADTAALKAEGQMVRDEVESFVENLDIRSAIEEAIAGTGSETIPYAPAGAETESYAPAEAGTKTNATTGTETEANTPTDTETETSGLTGAETESYGPNEDEIGPNLPEEMLGGGSVQTMASGKYEETLDIYTVDDLLAIDGHSNGYYTLQADLDISGMEWKPLNIPGSVFDGNGHTISGMTITDWANVDTASDSAGFFDCYYYVNTFVSGLRLTDININLTADAEHILDKDISAFGRANCENCYVDGSISVAGTESIDEGVRITVLSHATDSTAYVDFDVRINNRLDDVNYSLSYIYALESCVNSENHGEIYCDDCCWVDCIYNCVGCTQYGDMTASNCEDISAIRDSRDCEYYGDCEYNYDKGREYSSDSYLISYCDNCHVTGNFTFKSYITEPDDTTTQLKCIIIGSTDCTVTGDSSFNVPIRYKHIGLVNAIEYCKKCNIYGDISSGFDRAYGITYSEDCLIKGNITSNCNDYNVGIGGSYNSSIYGDIISTNDHGDTIGIGYGDNNYIDGNVTVQSGRALGISWGSNNNSINGNVTVQNGTARGIEDGSNNRIYGNVTAQNGVATGIYFSSGDYNTDNNYISGDVSTQNGYAYGVGLSYGYGGHYAYNNYIGGNVSAINGSAIGLDTNCTGYIGGIVSASYKGYTATSTAPLNNTYFVECNACHTLCIVATDGKLAHCYYYYDDGTPYPAGGDIRARAIYDENYEGSVTPDKPEPEPEKPEPPAPPEPPKASYAVRIIDTQTQTPVAGAAVTVDNATYTADENGVISLTDAPRAGNLKVEHGGAVIYSAGNFHPIPDQMNTVYVNGLSLSADDLILGNPASTVVEGPSVEIFDKKFNLFKLPISFDFNIFDTVDIAYDKDEGIYQVIIGADGNAGKWSNDIQDSKDPAWKKKYEEAKEFYEDLRKGNWKNHASSLKKSMVIEGNLAGKILLELKVEDSGLRLISGGAVMALNGEASSSFNLPPPWTVVYVAFGVEGEFLADSKLRIPDDSTLANPKLEMAADIDMSLTPYLGVGLGARDLLSVEAGLKGELGANLSLPMKSMEENFALDLTGQAYFRAAALALEFEKTWDFVKLGLYPKVGLASLASIDDLSQFKLIDRSYLAEAGDAALQAADTFKSNIYPYGGVKTARLDDGRIIMVWLDDDTSRPGLADKTALYYSVYEGGEWSTPAQIENDGTADFDFDLAAFGTTAAIVWQDTEKTFDVNKDFVELAKEIAANTGLSYSEFDGENWSAPVSVTEPNGTYEYSPSLDLGYNARIAWMRNASGGLLPETDGEGVSVYSSKFDRYYETVTKAAPVCENVPYVYGIESTGNNVIIIKDADGDPATEDYTLTLDGTDIDGWDRYTADSPITGLQYVDGTIYFIENGSVMSISESGNDTEPRKIIDAPGACGLKYVSDNGEQALIYEVQDGYTSNLYASYYRDGKWTNPVPITDFNEKIRSWDAQLDENGEIAVSAVLANIQIENGEISDPTRLVCTNAEIREDLAVNYVSVSDNATPGGRAEFTVNVTNRAMNDIDGLNVTLSGEGGELYGGTVGMTIPAGESADVTVSVTLPEDFDCQTVTATVSADGLTESDTSNNSASTLAGQGNLSVEIDNYKLKIDGTAEVTVRNTGCGEISGAMLTVTGVNGETLYTEELGTVAGGERRKITVPVDGKYLEDGSGLTAVITGGEGEAYEYDNEASCRVSQTVSIRPAERRVALKPGDTYESKFTVSPEGGAVYYLSSDPEVATVDENGVITAVGGGTATVTAMLTDSDATARMRVYVRELSAPQIISAEYNEYGTYGNVDVSVDISGCLLDGETETLIAAAYAEDGSLIGVSTRDVTASEDNSTFYASIYVSGTAVKPKKVKVMLWSSLTGMRPASLTATAEVTEQ